MNNSFFIGNRRRLMSTLEGEPAVIAGWTGMQWHGDSAAAFRQEANFWYLTGIEQPDWRLVVDGRQGKSWLIAPEIDETHQLFDGSLDAAAAKAVSGVDEVLGQEEGRQLLQSLAKKYAAVHTLGSPPYAKYADFILNPAPDSLHKELTRTFDTVKDCQQELAKQRAIKQPAEIEAMRRAAELTVEAFDRAKSKLSSCQYEYEVEAELTYHFRRHNAVHAFEPIVACGKNACTLHYSANTDKLEPGTLLLIDAGASLDGYPADVTRTYAVGGPARREAAVHGAVRHAQQQIVELIRPGLLLKSYLESVDVIMKDALLSLGLMKDTKDEANYRRYFPHAVSHGLGLDVHDSLGGYKELMPGMVLTVEPGIYIPEESVGVRIEDDIFVTENGHKNLTAGLSTEL